MNSSYKLRSSSSVSKEGVEIDQKIQTEWVVGPVLSTLVCTFCEMILHDPVQTPCEHVFCRDCMEDFIQKSKDPTCPIDRKPMAKQEWQRPALYLRQMLQELKVRCPEPNCGKVVQSDAFQGHRRACRLEKIVCEKGCATELVREELVNHDCIKELRDTVQDLRQQLSQQRAAEEVQYQRELVVGMKRSRNVLRQLRSSQGNYVALVTGQKNRERTAIVQPRSSGTFFINEKSLIGGRDESPIQDIGGVEWQVFLTKSNCFLKCHGPVNMTSNNWEIIINFVQIRNEISGDKAILRDQIVSPEKSIIGLLGLSLSLPGVFYVLFDRTTAQIEKAWSLEKVFLHDFSSLMSNAGCAMVSNDFGFYGMTWNLVLEKTYRGFPPVFSLRLVCNRDQEEDWGTCSVEYNLMFKTRYFDAIADYESGWKRHEFSHLSLMSKDFLELDSNNPNRNNFIVNDTLIAAAHLKIISSDEKKFAEGLRDNL